MPRTHLLKIRPEYFNAYLRGEKTAEIRFNDRDYQPYDTIVLQEFDPELHGSGAATGRERIVQIVGMTELDDVIESIRLHKWVVLYVVATRHITGREISMGSPELSGTEYGIGSPPPLPA